MLHGPSLLPPPKKHYSEGREALCGKALVVVGDFMDRIKTLTIKRREGTQKKTG